jgi:hypothetical protein
MVRRFFVASLSSVVASLVPAISREDADRDQSALAPRTWTLPEPEPLAVDPAITDRARRILAAVTGGTFDRSELMPQLDDFVPARAFVSGAALLTALGPPQSMFAFEKRLLADETSTFFRVHYRNAILTWVVSLDDAQKITGLSLRRSPNKIIFGVVYRNIQY